VQEVLASRILIVDDDAGVVRILRQILTREGFTHIASTSNPAETRGLFVQFQPDLVVLDLRMPELDGYRVMEQLRPLMPEGVFLPVLVLTGETAAEAKRRALAQGAHDLLQKPFDVVEVTLRIRRLLETRLLHLKLADQNQALELRVRERTRQRDKAQKEMLARLAAAGEARDDDTGRHTQRVGRLAARVASAIGLSPKRVGIIRQAAPLHDIGKIGVPDAVLLKPGKLTSEEYEIMKRHTIIGARILADGHCDFVRVAGLIARSHHERWDGSGYPDGLAGEAIPIEARIVGLVDVYDALTHDRPYRPAWDEARVLDHIAAERGRHFDPALVDAFLSGTVRRTDVPVCPVPVEVVHDAVA
jgi:putative two-component system response regulator